MKVFMFLINVIFWLWLFLVPTGLLGFLAYYLYFRSKDNLPFSILISIFGFGLGIVLAEYVRKKYGLDNFFGRLLATPDIDGKNVLDKNSEDTQKK